MNWNGLIFSALELICIVAGVFGLVRGIKNLKLLSVATQSDVLWFHFGRAIAWSLGAALVLGLNALIGGRSLSVLLVVMMLSVALIGSTILVALIRYRRLMRPMPIALEGLPGKARHVRVNSIVPGRVRGLNSGDQVRLEVEDEDALKGAVGFVRMIPWDMAQKARDFSGNTPLLGFWDNEGTQVLLYSDDAIELAQEGV